MLTVNIIGSGNVAHHLIQEILTHPSVILQKVYARNPANLTVEGLEQSIICNDIQELKTADITIISVTDQAIEDVSSMLPFSGQLVVHTSGTTHLDALNNKNRRGVFYPLQTFSKHKKVDFKKIPICLETENKTDLHTLQEFGKILSDEVHFINSAQRKALHVAAVFVNNFTNHLNSIAEDICEQNQIPSKILQPLLQETTDKLQTLSPLEAQTGPAVRHDQQTIAAHSAFIKDNLTREIYQKLTQSIQKHHGRKL